MTTKKPKRETGIAEKRTGNFSDARETLLQTPNCIYSNLEKDDWCICDSVGNLELIFCQPA